MSKNPDPRSKSNEIQIIFSIFLILDLGHWILDLGLDITPINA